MFGYLESINLNAVSQEIELSIVTVAGF